MLLAPTLILLALGFDVAFPDTAAGKIAAAYLPRSTVTITPCIAI